MSILDIFRKRKKAPEPQPQPIIEEPKPRERYILCIDGGGMRGIIPVVYLQELEAKIRKLGGRKPLQEYFDLVAGTSTGGLITISLTCPSSLPKEPQSNQTDLKRLSAIYRSMGKTIFPTTSILGLRQFASNKYPSEGIESLLYKWFGDGTLGQATTPTLVMAYNLSTGSAAPLRSYYEGSFPIWQTGRATSAAPTYFAPLVTNDGLLVDGGVIANNPSMYAYFESRTLYPDCRKFHILSLSTGGRSHTMQLDNTFGLLSWVDQVSPMFSTAQKWTCDYFCRNAEDIDYFRIDKPLKEDIKMDETNQDTLAKMEMFARTAIKEYDNQLEDLAMALVLNQGESVTEESVQENE